MKADNSRVTDDEAVGAGGTGAAEVGERWQRTAIAAFFRSEARGFAPGFELDDWLAAERELIQAPTPPTPSETAVAAHIESVEVLPREPRSTGTRVKRAPQTTKSQMARGSTKALASKKSAPSKRNTHTSDNKPGMDAKLGDMA